jgi:hypothetical protein
VKKDLRLHMIQLPTLVLLLNSLANQYVAPAA